MRDATKSHREQLEAAYTLLTEDTTTLVKFEKIRSLLMGINSQLDQALTSTAKSLTQLKKVWNLDIIHISIDVLPTRTSEEKKRKKALLLFLTSWRSLKNEVKRVQGYETSGESVSATTVKTALFAKGPFGTITLVAAAIVGIGLFFRSSLTTVTIINNNCPSFSVPSNIPKIPGIKLPSSAITPDNPGVVTIPILTVEVSGTSSQLQFSTLGVSGSYTLPTRITAVTFDGESLLGKQTTLKLSSQSAHELLLTCQK
jgi:hypothetical protein